MSSHQLDLSVLQERNRNEGRSCQQCVPQDSSAHTQGRCTGTVSLWSADKGKGLLCKAVNEPIVTGQSKVLHGKSQHSWGHKALQAHEWIRKDKEYCTIISLLLKCSQVWAGCSCLGSTSLRNKQAASASMAVALQPPRQHWTCFLGDRRHLRSQLHKRQKNNSCVCVCAHMFIHDVHADTDLWFLSSSSSFVSTSPALCPCQLLSHLCLDVTWNPLH